MNAANNAVDLPSLEEIEQMYKQQQNALDSLEISITTITDDDDDDDDDEKTSYVKCQKCGRRIAMFQKSPRSYSVSNRITVLEKQIKQDEIRNNHYPNNDNEYNDIMESKQELADLLKEEEKNDLVTRLPLYSSRMTGYKWICSGCWDKAYRSLHHHQTN
jgi:DNA-directed RNA polymerase subunit RPC12/RpoP